MNREIKFRIGDKELKEGMYVRTAFGIKRICEINHKAEKWKYLYKLKKQDGDGCIDLGQLCDDDIIGAPSFNVIDLIEENDLLEIRYKIKSNEYQKEVVQVIKNYTGKLYANAFVKKIFIEDFDRYGVEILSVLTKEQFGSQKYYVESE